MKRYTALFAAAALVLCLAGCRMAEQMPADGTGVTTMPTETEPTHSGATQSEGNGASEILSAIWGKYAEDERFAIYGGMMNNPVDNAPGNLDMSVAEEIASKYLLPADLLAQVDEGASMVHLMNSNLFTSAVFLLKEQTNMEAFAKTLRDNIQKNQWICGQPDKLLVARAEGNYLLVAFGSEDAMQTFNTRFAQSFSGANIFYNEAVVA